MNKFPQISRRDFFKITAAAGSALLGGKLISDLLREERLVSIRDTRVLMGTIINLVVIAGTTIEAKTAIDATFTEIKRQIKIFDHRLSESPITQLNQAGILENPPRELVFVLEQALSVSERTNGAFDITIKPLADLYQQTQPVLPDSAMVQKTLELVNYNKIDLTAEKISFSQPAMAITLDAIAKGYIVDAGVAKLKDLGYQSVFVEAGGDLMAAGLKESDKPWKVGIRSPRQKHSGTIASFNISDRAVATSGDYMQYYSSDLTHHHILDSRTGRSPLELASVTVVAPTCLEADALATAVTVLGKTKGLALINELPDVETLLVAKDMEKYQSMSF